MTKLQKLRLFKLAEHLENMSAEDILEPEARKEILPFKPAISVLAYKTIEPTKFDMRGIVSLSPCGTACCALGWGIYLALKDKRFTNFENCEDPGDKLYGLSSGNPEWHWIFSGQWEDGPQNAACRIYWLLAERQVPLSTHDFPALMRKLPSLKFLKALARAKVSENDKVS